MIGIITAGGLGTRMRPITDFMPKELLMYGDKPFIGHCLESFKRIGITKIHIIIGHKKGSIIDYVKDGSTFGVDVNYIYQKEPKGLGDAILCTKRKINDNDMFVILGDNIINPYSELERMIDVYRAEKPIALILLEKVSNPESYGVIKFDHIEGDKFIINDLFEKPRTKNEKSKYNYNGFFYVISGAYILNRKMFKYLEITEPGYNNEIQLTDAFKLALDNKERVIGILLNGKRIDIGNMNMYLKAQKDWFLNFNCK